MRTGRRAKKGFSSSSFGFPGARQRLLRCGLGDSTAHDPIAEIVWITLAGSGPEKPDWVKIRASAIYAQHRLVPFGRGSLTLFSLAWQSARTGAAFGVTIFSPLPDIAVNREIFERQATICKAFANPVRLEMLDLLGSGEWVVGDLQERLGISNANMSQHIAVLKAAGVVETRRSGRHFYSALTLPEVKQACQLIHDVLRAQVRKGRKLEI